MALSPHIAVTNGRDETPKSGSTLDLRALAMVGKSERVEIQQVADQTLHAFDQTIRIISEKGGHGQPRSFSETIMQRVEEAPKDSELRKAFVFAEILGGYDAFNDLSRLDSPTYALYQSYHEVVEYRELTRHELARLEEYHGALRTAVENAKTYYRETKLKGFSLDEMNELYGMATRARDMAKEITEIIGKHLILKMERAIGNLNEIRLKALGVERSVSGVFLVDDEVMYIPVGELKEAIDVIFKGVGNPYLAGNVDGVMLLAARNLLIEVVSFFAYYGKHQIYQLFTQGQTVDRQRMMLRIRNEIKKILNACKESNKLVLTRIMDKEEEQLDLSIEAIQREAEKQAVEAVIRIMPQQEVPAPPPEKTWFQKVIGWFMK